MDCSTAKYERREMQKLAYYKMCCLMQNPYIFIINIQLAKVTLDWLNIIKAAIWDSMMRKHTRLLSIFSLKDCQRCHNLALPVNSSSNGPFCSGSYVIESQQPHSDSHIYFYLCSNPFNKLELFKCTEVSETRKKCGSLVTWFFHHKWKDKKLHKNLK